MASSASAEEAEAAAAARVSAGDPPGGDEKYEEALALRRRAGTLRTVEGANLLQKIGDLRAGDFFQDVAGALELYAEALEIREEMGVLQTLEGAQLIQRAAKMKLEALDPESALHLYEAARRIHDARGTLESPDGKELKTIIEDVTVEKKMHSIKAVFEDYDTSTDGRFPNDIFHKLFDSKDGAEAADRLLGMTGSTSEGSFSYVKLLYYLFPDTALTQSQAALQSGPAASPMLGCRGGGFACREGSMMLPTLVWSLQPPKPQPNLLGLLPARGSPALKQATRSSLVKLLQAAREMMLHPGTSQRLETILADLVPYEHCDELERAPLTDGEALRGLEAWLESRKPEWQDLWPGSDAAQVAKQWASYPQERWKYWKRQTLHDWLRDDASGGALNPLLVARSPTIDTACRSLGLAAADEAYAAHPQRHQRAPWMQSSIPAGELPKSGKHDFFKLLVWDLVLNSIVSKAKVTKAQLDPLLKALQPPGPQAWLEQALTEVVKADLVVLTEVLKAGLPEVPDFWAVPSAPGSSGVTILARRAVLDEPKVLSVVDGDPRIAACSLTGKGTDGRPLRIIAVSCPAESPMDASTASALEAALGQDTILVGDFGVDLRRRRPAWLDAVQTPKLAKFLAQAQQLPLLFCGGSRVSSPFTAEVSTMFKADVSLRHFALLGESFLEAPAQGGLVPFGQCLPKVGEDLGSAALRFSLSWRRVPNLAHRGTGMGRMYLAGLKVDVPHSSIQDIDTTVQPRCGTMDEFRAKYSSDTRTLERLQNQVKMCPACKKGNAYTLTACNSCGYDLKEVPVSHTDNVFMGFVYGIGKGKFPYTISLRKQTPDLLCFDDPLAVTVCHLNVIPTSVYCPDLRYLFTDPARGLDLINSLFQLGAEACLEGFWRDEVFRKYYFADRAVPGDCEGVFDTVICGMNFPPSIFQLHLQFIHPPLMPFHYNLFQEGAHFSYRRFFPLEYLRAALALGPRARMEVSADTDIEEVIRKMTELGVDYDEYHGHQMKRCTRVHEAFSPWKESDFTGVVCNKQMISFEKGLDPDADPNAIQAEDKKSIQNYGRPYLEGGKFTGTYYKYAKEPSEVASFAPG